MKLDNIAAAYPLSPMQSSMLFYAQTQQAANQEDVLFNQVNLKIHGHLDTNAFRQAWQQVIDSNDAFRTGFVWAGLAQPQQFVCKAVECPWQLHDFSHLTTEQQSTALNQLQATDKKLGFALTEAPLIRLNLCKLSETTHHLIWSSHHLIIDRWCIGLVFNMLGVAYNRASTQGTAALSAQPPFKRYMAWLLKHETCQSAQYWQGQLGGFSTPSQLCRRAAEAPSSQYSMALDEVQTQAIKQFCRQHKLTLANLFQAVWALTLNRVLGSRDLVFGLVVAGRPAAVKDIENIVGTFVNNIPLRYQLSGDLVLHEWLSQQQKDAQKRTLYEHEAASQLHSYTLLGNDAPLFDHILVWQNATTLAAPSGLEIVAETGLLETAYPFTLCIEETQRGLQVDGTIKAGWTLVDNDVLAHCQHLLTAVTTQTSAARLADIDGFVEDKGLAELNAKTVVSPPVSLTRVTQTPQKALDNLAAGRTLLTESMVSEFLVREWQRILEIDHVGLDDDFFALGGNSLKAAQLVARLEQMEQKQIAMISLFAGRTIRSMTKIYLESDWSIKPDWIIPVNSKGSGTPIFYIASPEVNTLGYLQLALELGRDISGYIVQPPPQTNHIRQVRTHEIPALATTYVDEIRQIQPTGPYRIVGMCTGGQIAAEIVRQLEQSAERIGFFGVINTWSWYTTTKLYHLEKVIDVYRMARYYAKRLANMQWAEVRDRFLPALQQKVAVGSSTQSASSTVSADLHTPPPIQYDPTVSHTEEDGWAGQRPESLAKIHHPVTVFRLKERPYWRINSESQGWDLMADTTRVVYLKDTPHEDILREPHIRDFAQRFRAALDLTP